MSEDQLVRNCAPTLAGIKTASLFTCPCEDRVELLSFVRDMNRRLYAKGLRVLPLRFSERTALIYLYRPKKLTADLSDPDAGELLRCCGYDAGSCQHSIAQLARRLRQREDFPHEIGLFLGYPAEDVRGFIEQGPEGCKCVGCWRVYGDEDAARKTFARYKKCTRVYCDSWARNHDIERLTVAV